MALDRSQTAEARRLEAEVNKAYAAYITAAERVTQAWKDAGRPREGGYFDPKAKSYNDYLNAQEDKQGAYTSWQRAASRHGHYLIPNAETQSS